MLTRALHRRQNLRYAQHAAEHIQLPWLCPALRSSHTTYTHTARRPVTPRPSLSRCRSAASLTSTAPRLAAAAPTPSLLDLSDGYTPFEFSRHSSPSTPSYELPSLSPDLKDILMIDHSTAAGPEVLDTGKKHKFIRGNAWEIEATLDACLQIHRWDRCFDLLSQLYAFYKNDHAQLQRLYNKVLEGMVYDHVWNRSVENVKRINTWVELDMTKAGVRPNAQTFALKIKAALATLQGRKRDRTVRRYWAMAKEYNVDWEVASLRGILSDSDLGKLSEISPLETGVEEDAEKAEDLEDPISIREDLISQPAMPDIKETDQKGLGMISLKRSLSLFDNASQSDEWENVKNADAETRAAYAKQRQLRLEQDSLKSAADRWRVEHEKMIRMGIHGNMSHGKIGSLLWDWHAKLTDSIKSELNKVSLAEASSKKSEEEKLRAEYGPFLRLLTPEEMSALTVTTIVQLMTKHGVQTPIKLARLVADLGRTVEGEVEVLGKRHRDFSRQSRLSTQQNRQKSASDVAERAIVPEDVADTLQPPSRQIYWSITQCAKLGSILCELLTDIARVEVYQEDALGRKSVAHQSAFDRTTLYINGRRQGVVAMHTELATLLTKEPVADVLAKQLPMVCEPKPWSGFDEGGYFQAKNQVLRIKNVDHAQREYTRAAAERGDLDQMFKGLDVLGQTGWRINLNVFKVMVDAWNSGEGIANLPPVEKVFAEVPDPGAAASARERYQYHRQVQAINNEKSGLHSNRCFQNFQMEIAKAFANEAFYLPHNVDFRGRAYPIPPYLNQMGADNARGLLIFDKGRPLGEQGLKWLKVHLANVCGYDKASLVDRARFADDHLADMRDSVQNPLTGRRWWLQAEDPWQCLAACHELLAAIDSENPYTYVSHLPVHQDGTCNGLQHYAALGGDMAGARQVNLEPGDKPADVYTGVAELVKAEIKKDAEAGHQMAKLLDGRITRKVVKQTVMTNVYGVTFNGAMQQVKKQLNDLLPDIKEKKLSGPASSYIARKIFKGLGTLFEGAHGIQYWFGDCANRITNSISLAQLEEASRADSDNVRASKDKRVKKDLSLAERQTLEPTDYRSTVVWTTPLRLPVVQPYRVSRAQVVKTHMASIILSEPNVSDSVDKRKQLQAFPPNFIHSLDATHMMLSALQAHEQGLTFSAVHDSFWTHAADIDTLSTLLRDAFVRMHTEDIIGRLAAEFQTRYKGHIFMAKISSTNPLAKKIAAYRAETKIAGSNGEKSVKKGKKNVSEKRRQYHELMQEHKRQKLLASEDPEQRKEGEKMVTPASLFEAMNGEQYLKVKNSLGETALGNIPESQVDPTGAVIEAALDHESGTELHDVDMSSTLDPLLESQEADGDSSLKSKSSRSESSKNSVWVWLPLTFKDIPKKGDWDISRLKESVYFFS